MAADNFDLGSSLSASQQPASPLSGGQPQASAEPSAELASEGEFEPQIDATKAAALFEQLVQRQNLPLGIAAGLAASIVGAVAWAVVTNVTGYQIGWMAIGIGCLVGFAIRTTGRGLTRSFGIAGGVLSLAGCLLGNVLAICGLLAAQEGWPVVTTTLSVLTNPTTVMTLIADTFHPMDALFYAIAVYEGFKFSFRQVSPEELQTMIS